MIRRRKHADGESEISRARRGWKAQPAIAWSAVPCGPTATPRRRAAGSPLGAQYRTTHSGGQSRGGEQWSKNSEGYNVGAPATRCDGRGEGGSLPIKVATKGTGHTYVVIFYEREVQQSQRSK